MLEDGFEYKGQHFDSLSGVGRYCNAGKSTNGFVFFGLTSVPNQELRDVDGIVAGYNAIAKDAGLSNGEKDLAKILEGSVPDAHRSYVKIQETIEALRATERALRMGAKLIEHKKGKPATTA